MRFRDTVTIDDRSWAVHVERFASFGEVVSFRGPARDVGEMLVFSKSFDRPHPVVVMWDRTGLTSGGDLMAFDLVERGRFTLATMTVTHQRIGSTRA